MLFWLPPAGCNGFPYDRTYQLGASPDIGSGLLLTQPTCVPWSCLCSFPCHLMLLAPESSWSYDWQNSDPEGQVQVHSLLVKHSTSTGAQSYSQWDDIFDYFFFMKQFYYVQSPISISMQSWNNMHKSWKKSNNRLIF